MKTEAELRESYLEVAHPVHAKRIGRTEFGCLYCNFGTLLCWFTKGSGLRIRISDIPPIWGSVEEYIYTYRTDLSDADKIALILKYS